MSLYKIVNPVQKHKPQKNNNPIQKQLPKNESHTKLSIHTIF